MPGPVSYADKGGGGALPPHGEDYFNRIVNVHWPKRVSAGPLQALVSLDSGSSVDLFFALGGGVFSSGNRAASGFGFTVVSDGFVTFGMPRDKPPGLERKDPFFIASYDNSGTIYKSVGADPLNFTWTSATSVPGQVRGMSCCNGIFFITSFDNGTVYVTSSANGTEWSITSVGVVKETGAVAFGNGTYCLVGRADGSHINEYSSFGYGVSSDGFSWSGGLTDDVPVGGMSSDVAFGNGTFVSGGFKFGIYDDGHVRHGTADATAVLSSTGSSWTSTAPILTVDPVQNAAFGSSAIFVGQFILIVTGSGQGMPAVLAYTSYDGGSWSQANSWGDAYTGPQFSGLCAISTVPGRIVQF